MSEEKIGYCRPPEKHRFKKGQSGNPTGRPPKLKPTACNDEGEIIRRLDAGILHVGGRSMSRREAELRKIRELAFSGNRHAIRLLGAVRAKVTAQRGGGVVRMPASYFSGESDDEK